MLILNSLRFWNVNKQLSLLSLSWDKWLLLMGCRRSLSLTTGLLLSVNSSQHSSLAMASVTLNLLPIIHHLMGSLKGQSKLLSLPWRSHTYHFLSGCHGFYFATASPLTLQLDTFQQKCLWVIDSDLDSHSCYLMHLEKSTCHRIARSWGMISTLKWECSILVKQCLFVMCVTKLLPGYRVSLCHRLVPYLTRSSLTGVLARTRKPNG